MDGFLVSASISVSVFSCWHFLLTCFVRSLLDSGEVWQNRQSSSPWAPLDCLWASLHHCTHTPLSCHEPPLGTCSYRPWPGLTWALTPRLSKRMWTFPDGEKGWDLVLTSLSYFLYCDPGHLTVFSYFLFLQHSACRPPATWFPKLYLWLPRAWIPVLDSLDWI